MLPTRSVVTLTRSNGKDKVEAAVDSYGKHMSSSCTSDPDEVKFTEEVMGKMKKKTKPREKLVKKKKETQIDSVRAPHEPRASLIGLSENAILGIFWPS